MSDQSEDFLSRWSRRKTEAREVKEEGEDIAPLDGVPRQDALPVPAEETVKEQADTQGDEAPAEALEVDPSEFDNFDFDSLTYESDYQRFMKSGVPDAVRRRALRQLWGSNPILANLDGMNEYDEDYTDAALAVKVLQSAWRPGKGYAKDEEEETQETDSANAQAPADQSETASAEQGDEAQPSEGEDDKATAQSDETAALNEDSDAGEDDDLGTDEG